MGRVFVAALLLALAAAGPVAGANVESAAAVAPPAAAPVRILALGDFGVGGTTEQAMGDALRAYEARHPADALLTLGDNDYTERPRSFHRNWTRAFGWVAAAGVVPAGTLGNHDVRVDGGRYEFDELHMPRARYARVVGSVQLVILNSNGVTRRQKRWLASTLAATRATWKIVALHHPAYTCGGYLGNSAVQSRWVPVFERYGVAVVVSGHDHNYQRFGAKNGVRYVVHGGGGQELYGLGSCPKAYPKRLAARAVHGFLAIRADDSSLVLRSVRRSGRTIDKLILYP